MTTLRQRVWPTAVVLLALGAGVATTGCSALPQGRGATIAAIDDRLEPVAQGLDGLSLLLETFRTTLRGADAAATAASSRTAALEVSVERAQARAAAAERDIRGARDEIRAFATKLGAIDPDAVADAGLGWLEVLAGGAGGAAGLDTVLAGIRQVLRREQRLAVQADRDRTAAPGGGPVEPTPARDT